MLLSIMFWGMAVYWFTRQSHDISPASMARAVSNNLVDKENKMQRVIDDNELIKGIFSEHLDSRDVKELTELPFGLYAYKDSSLVFWNNNKTLAACADSEAEKLVFNERGVFVQKCYRPKYLSKGEVITVLFPIVIQYPFENKYLESRFEAGNHIPMETRISANPVKGGYAVTDISGKHIFYLKFNTTGLPGWMPDTLMICLLLAALLTTIAWLQLLSVNISRKRSPILGFLLTLVLVIGTRVLTYKFGLPFHLRSMPIFDPRLYATSALHPSLGDLLLNSLCFLWIVAYMLANTSVISVEPAKLSKHLKIVVSLLCAATILICAFWFINIISSLVLDSAISFDVSHFYSISKYTLFGLLTIGIITLGCCLFIYLLNIQLSTLVTNKWAKYLLLTVLGIIMTLLSDKTRTGSMSYLMFVWFLLFIILLDVKKLTYSRDVLAPHMIFWAFFVCAFCTGVLFYFNDVKEKRTRERFAEDMTQPRRDYASEYDFDIKNISKNVENDRVIQAFIKTPNRELRRELNERFGVLYLNGQLNKYQTNIYVFDAAGRSLYNNDTASYNSLWKIVRQSIPTADSNLYFRGDAQDGHYYISSVPVYDYNHTKKVGYVFLDLAIKQATGESLYPELLQPNKTMGNENEAGYSYGIYVNRKLLTQTNDYAFPLLISGKETTPYAYYDKEGYSELWYTDASDKSKTVVVVHRTNTVLELITLFSYLFGIQVITALLIVIYRSALSYLVMPKASGKFISFTLRRRIHFSMLGIVLVSFLIIGLVTIIYFQVQYDQGNRKKLLGIIQNVERTVVQHLAQQNGLADIEAFNNATSTPGFKYFIVDLSNNQKIDINIYKASGLLDVTSQDNIYDRALLARIMRADAYYQLSQNNTSLLTQNERIGKLSYLSCYVPIRDESGNALGYINIPYFSSQKELSYQISNILVALINLYAFIFLLSGLLTVFITRWITRSFNVVIERFEKLNLSKNELVDWPYDDEIGLLIKEYNKMVKNVEENAILMAQSEREGAWREMAQQVAHEIKNPLTPMKLNIQYLQQALKNKYSNVQELTEKVADSLIEQIDNLSYIASEFSNFAKMPEARPEVIELNDLAERVVELYLNEQQVKVSAMPYAEPVYVYADYSQLLRVCTNLIINAIQAMPEGRTGVVNVVVDRKDQQAIIAIKDNGAGISEDKIDKIFQPYFTTKSSGTGLGLAMTKKIIEFWKGTIWFETEVGKGTTFFISLPSIKKDDATKPVPRVPA
ncbi:MAG: ATP-binding protein [Bacteroidetes bacterium]|nr:ATP-binding protein [Bacteroidota bacterium]